MKKILFLISIFSSFFSIGQNDEQADVMAAINQVFEAMRTNDSTLLMQSFTENPYMFTAFIDQEGKSKLVTGDFQRFKKAVGQPKDQVWNEPIWNEKVSIDGNLASVWVDYAFFVDDEFSHCGIDAFHLIRREDGWKIFHLVDTRRKNNCEIPDEIKP